MRGNGFAEKYLLRGIGCLNVVSDGIIFHHEGIIVGRHELYAAENLGIAEPLPGLRHHLNVQAADVRGQRPLAESPVSEPDRKIKGIYLFACDQVLRSVHPRAVGVHDTHGDRRQVLAFGHYLVFKVNGLVLVISIPFPVGQARCGVKDLGEPAVYLQPLERTQSAVIIAVRRHLA
jgi:hypothetical protein